MNKEDPMSAFAQATGYARMVELAKRCVRANARMARHYGGTYRRWNKWSHRRGGMHSREVNRNEAKLYALQEPGYMFYEDFLEAHNHSVIRQPSDSDNIHQKPTDGN